MQTFVLICLALAIIQGSECITPQKLTICREVIKELCPLETKTDCVPAFRLGEVESYPQNLYGNAVQVLKENLFDDIKYALIPLPACIRSDIFSTLGQTEREAVIDKLNADSSVEPFYSTLLVSDSLVVYHSYAVRYLSKSDPMSLLEMLFGLDKAGSELAKTSIRLSMDVQHYIAGVVAEQAVTDPAYNLLYLKLALSAMINGKRKPSEVQTSLQTLFGNPEQMWLDLNSLMVDIDVMRTALLGQYGDKSYADFVLDNIEKSNISDQLKSMYTYLIQSIIKPHSFLAYRLYYALNSNVADLEIVARVVFTRFEVDIGNIISEYNAIEAVVNAQSSFAKDLKAKESVNQGLVNLLLTYLNGGNRQY